MQCSLLKKIGLPQNHVTKYFVATTHLFHTASLSLVVVVVVVAVVVVVVVDVVVVVVVLVLVIVLVIVLVLVVVVVVVVKISSFPAPKTTHASNKNRGHMALAAVFWSDDGCYACDFFFQSHWKNLTKYKKLGT